MNYRKGVRKVSERRATQYDNRPLLIITTIFVLIVTTEKEDLG